LNVHAREVGAGDREVDVRVDVGTSLGGLMLARLGDLDRPALALVDERAGDILTSFEIDAGGRVITVVTAGADEVPARGHWRVYGVAPGGYPVISGAGAVLAGRVGAGRCQGERRGTESACRREVEVVRARFVVHLLDDRQVSQRLVVV